MNHTHAKLVEDGAEKRRSYLFTITKAIILSAVGCGCVPCFGIITLIFGSAFVCASWYPNPWVSGAGGFIGMLLSGTLTVRSVKFVASCENKIKSLPYVPPVRDRIAVLAGDEREGRTYSASVNERAKKRREYLRNKAALAVVTFTAGVVALLCGLCATLGWFGNDFPYCLPSVFGFGFACSLFTRLLRTSASKSKALPYVAPVHAQIAALPGNQVLLRSSDVPPGSDSLLRAASGSETGSDELLRPSGRTT